MPKYKDFTFSEGNYVKASEFTDNNALVLGIRNILLSRPGNFPFNPSLGMNIEKYNFDLLDDQTIANIKKELNRQMALYMPDLENIQIRIEKVDSDDGMPYLGILVTTTMNGQALDASFLLKQQGDSLDIYNEIN